MNLEVLHLVLFISIDITVSLEEIRQATSRETKLSSCVVGVEHVHDVQAQVPL